MPDQSPETPASRASLNREKARLRKIGVIVLLVGFIGAGLVYWRGNRAPDPRLAQYEETQSRAESRQMETLYGTSGGVAQDFLNALKLPGNQALVILCVTVLIAGGCFYLGHPLPEGEETP